MKELNDEITLTINLMRGAIDDYAHSELQYHLAVLLEIKRNEIYKRLVKPLTVEDLKAGGWWCADTSEEALKAFALYGLEDESCAPWDGSYYACFLLEQGRNLLDLGLECHTSALKQIHRIGNEFYWGTCTSEICM